jgi:class 3 adenylate cyclase/tetratricopeptide (TPR) repeat protein
MIECSACGARAADDARFCASCGARLSPAVEHRVREQRKTVTAVFIDIVGSTALASRLDPEALRAVMSRFYNVMRGEIERHGGRVDKFIGDAVVAFFGVPVAHEDDALRAVRAAAGMRAALAVLNDELDQRFGVRLQTRTGVNTGDVLAGDVSRSDTFTVGDAVNVAARLEQAAAPGEVVLGETTYQLVRHAARIEQIGSLAVKGKDDPLPAYRLVDVAEHAPSMPRRLDSPLIGRDVELHRAATAFETVARERTCHLLQILGAAGAGKSRLAAEVIDQVETRATVWYGRCLSYGEGITFWPLVEIIRGAAGIVDVDSAADVIDKLGKLVEGDDDATLIADRLAVVIGAVPGAAGADEISWAVRKLFEAAARRQPLLVVLDDVHWAEPTLLDLVDRVVEWTRHAPIMVMCIARPEILDRRPSWAVRGHDATTIHLEPLTDDDSATLIDTLLGGSSLQPELRSRIITAAEGIPLFVEEMLGMLIDSGRLRRVDDGWQTVGGLDDIAIPPTIRAVLTARLDALPAEERRILEAAAVVGKEFWREAVAVISPHELREGAGLLLDELLRKDLVVPEWSAIRGEEGFRFRHILIRDATYEAIPKVDRAAMHEQFAAWLADAYRGRAAEVDEIIGYHLQEAHRNRVALGPPDETARALAERSAGHLLAAGRRALDRNDFHGATNLLSRAHALSETAGAELLLAYGSALAHSGSLSRALEMLRSAVEAAAGAGDAGLAWHARIEELSWRAQVDTGAGVSTEILATVPDAVQRFEHLGDDAGAARAWLSIAAAHNVLGHHADALEAAERALDFAERAGDDGLVLDAYRRIGAAVIWGPLPLSEAEQRYGDLLDRIGGGPLRKVAATELVAALKTQLGHVDEGRALIAKARALYNELGDRLFSAKAAMIEHRGPLGEDDFATAEQIVGEACDILEAAGERSWLSTSLAVWASTLYALDRLEDAYRATVKSEQAGSADDAVTQAYWRAERAKVLARWGRGEEAIALVRDAIRILDATDGVLEQADVYVAFGEVHRVLGHADEARDAWVEAVARYEAKGAAPFARQIRVRLTQLSAG